MVQELFRFQKCLHHLSGNRIRKDQQVAGINICFVFNHDLSSWGLTFPNHLNKSGFFFESIIILNFILLPLILLKILQTSKFVVLLSADVNVMKLNLLLRWLLSWLKALELSLDYLVGVTDILRDENVVNKIMDIQK